MYVLILAVTVVVVVFMAAGMRMAYRQGFADGQFAASVKHTESVLQQWAEEQMRNSHSKKNRQ